MTTAQQIVVGVFDDRSQAELAVDELLQAGFRNDQIRYSGHGANSGGMLESLKSLFAGQETGGVYDDLVALGVQQNDATSYQREFEAGRSIVAVQTSDRMQDATAILARSGARRSSEQTSGYATNVTDTDIPQTATNGEQRLKLREEQLNVQKQSVETGEARLRKDVVSEQQSIDVPVTHEEVYIERRPGSGQTSDTPIGDSETYRVPVREEQVTASKQTIETGEVAIGKRQYQDTQRVSETVQREEAHIESSGDVAIKGNDGEELSN